MQHRASALCALVFTAAAVRRAGAVVPSTRVDTQTSPSLTSVWIPPASYEDSGVHPTFTFAAKPGGVTEAKMSGDAGYLLSFFGPGLQQYFLATASIYGVAHAEFGVLRAYAYAAGGVAPKLWGPGFVLGVNPYAGYARAVMRPQFTDGFTSPASPGAPNTGNTQMLTAQIELDGSIGTTGNASATWLITLQIVSDTNPQESVFSATYSSSGCGGPCPFPLHTTAIDFPTKIGTSYIVVGDLGITAFASGSATSTDSGFNVAAIDAANTGKFFVRVKETGDGVIGLSGHDYGAPVPPGTIEIPTTTTLKLPPDSTTSTTPATTSTTTTTLDGVTTTSTTQPTASEQCDNCLDDDGDGLVDAEDADCCAGTPLLLTLRKVRIASASATTALRLSAALPGAAVAGLDPTVAGLTLQLRDPAGGELLCTHLPAAGFARKKKGRLFAFRDPAGAAHGITAAALHAGKRDDILTLEGKPITLDDAPGSTLQVTAAISDASGRRCLAAPVASLRSAGKKGGLRFP
ncbi:MAG TPA: hypothetical protein VGR62_15290 [Candidatus Binatia bacterium]|jgi:hypothetical protein|nr:hypothetical protein [Candidatus Binatia bacterium]